MKKTILTFFLLSLIAHVHAQKVSDSENETVYSSNSGRRVLPGSLYIGGSLDLNKANYTTSDFLGLQKYEIDFGTFLSPAIFAEYTRNFGQILGLSYGLGLNYAFSDRKTSTSIRINSRDQIVNSEFKQRTLSTPMFLRYTFPLESEIKPYIDLGYQFDWSNNSSMSFDYPFTNTVDGVASRASVIYSIGMKISKFNIRFRGYLKPSNAVEPIVGFEYGHRVNSLLCLSYQVM